MNKSYFFKCLCTLLLSVVFFLFFKMHLPERLFVQNEPDVKTRIIDSVLIDLMAQDDDELLDSLGVLLESEISDLRKKTFFTDTPEKYVGYQHMLNFFEKLYEVEKGELPNSKVRIAYFGDSMTDGDMIVQDLRAQLQDIFGGKGVGFVNVASESSASRSSIKHLHSSNWKIQSYLNVKNPLSPFGVNGNVFFAQDSTKKYWIDYKAGQIRHSQKLNRPKLFYGYSSNPKAKAEIIIDNDTVVKFLNGKNILNSIQLSPQDDLDRVRLNFSNLDSLPLFGVNFDNGEGVHVDNFSSRGNSGLPISIFDKELMNAFQAELGYDLIVLHFGTNVLNYHNKNYGWYAKGMGRVINHIRECFPGASILIVSTADKATKYGTEMRTDSAVVPLTKAQEKYAKNNHASFYNLYLEMGGDNAMVRWVDGDPSMGNKDYTHFNYQGAKKVGGMIHDFILKGYQTYKLQRKIMSLPSQNQVHTLEGDETK